MKLEKSFLFFTSILIVLLPFFLIKSATADAACILIGTLYLFFCIYKNNFDYFKNKFFYFFIIIYFYINLNSFFSSESEISFLTSAPYLRILLFIISLSFFFREQINLKKYFYYSFLICILILLIDSIYQIYTGHNILGYLAGEDSTRISSFFGNKLIMGSYTAKLLPLFIAIGFLLKFKKLNLFILIISSILIVFSSERVALLYLLITIIAYLYLTFDLKKITYLIFIFFTLFLSLYLIFPKNYNRIFVHTYQQLKETNNFLGLSYRHQLHFITAYRIFLDSKLIGHGIKTFRYLCDKPKFSVNDKIVNDHSKKSPVEGKFILAIEGEKKFARIVDDNNKVIFESETYDHTEFFVQSGDLIENGQKIYISYEFKNGCNTHPHNIYLQFLSELGIIGFLLFSSIFIYSFYLLVATFKRSFKSKLNNLEKCCFFTLLGVFTSMFPFFPSGNYFNNWMLIINYLPIGFYLSLVTKKNV